MVGDIFTQLAQRRRSDDRVDPGAGRPEKW